MVRIIGPLMSMEAHGKLGNTITFTTNEKGQYAKFQTAQKNANTLKQRAVRQAYGNIATLWRSLTPEQKQTYHEEAVRNRRTDYNEFFHQIWPEYYP